MVAGKFPASCSYSHDCYNNFPWVTKLLHCYSLCLVFDILILSKLGFIIPLWMIWITHKIMTSYNDLLHSPEGVEALCSDLKVDCTDVRILMLAW